MPPTLAEQISVITDAALQDIAGVWQSASVDTIIDVLHELMPGLIDTWASAAAAFAADWYDLQRELNDIDGTFTAIVPPLGDKGANALVGWATEPLRQPEPDFAAARSKLEGGTQRRIADSARETLMTSSVEDPKARGWRRVVRPGACGFCRMLAQRGYKYKTKESSRFGSHDDCHCSVEPGWSSGRYKVREFTPSTRDISDTQRDATYEWIKENLPIA